MSSLDPNNKDEKKKIKALKKDRKTLQEWLTRIDTMMEEIGQQMTADEANTLNLKKLHDLEDNELTRYINIGEVKRIFFGLPDKNEQEEIAKRLVAIQERIDSSKRELAKHASIKTALMQDLLTGEVRVTPLFSEPHEAEA